jgi:hypothetical protein
MDTYYLGQLLVKSGIWMDCMIAWMAVADEWVQSAGYSLLAQRLKDDADSIPDDLAKKTLVAIEKGIHKAANRARYNMNTALIAIGTYKPGLRDAALAAADAAQAHNLSLLSSNFIPIVYPVHIGLSISKLMQIGY